MFALRPSNSNLSIRDSKAVIVTEVEPGGLQEVPGIKGLFWTLSLWYKAILVGQQQAHK